MKKIKIFIVLLLMVSILNGCSGGGKADVEYLSNVFYGPFDTEFRLNAYATEEEFKEHFSILRTEIERLDHLYDKYNNYEGINNIKTINDFAGIKAVEVDQDIIDLLNFSIETAKAISFKTNIALGPVTNIWHYYRELNNGSIPTLEELKVANQYTDLTNIIIDNENNTVYLPDKNMILDVGATAKGYAAELARNKLVENGCESFILSAGGNIVSYGERLIDNSNNSLSEVLPACITNFCVGITSPGTDSYQDKENIAAIVAKDGISIVTSGDYERYFIGNDGQRYHHLIDPDTLFPGNYMRSLTIITKRSDMADFLSTIVFLNPYEIGLEIVENLEDVEAVWLLNDGSIKVSSGLVEGENIHIYEE